MNSVIKIFVILCLAIAAQPMMAQGADNPRTKVGKYAKAKSQEILTPDMPQWYVEKARKLIKKGAWRSAKTVLDKAVETFPDDPNTRWLLGRYYEHVGDLDKARYNLLKCLDNDNMHISAKKSMVGVEVKSKHYSNALAYCNELLEVVPYEKTIWRKKIELYRLMKNTRMADLILDRMLKIFPGDKQIERDINYQKEMAYLKNIKDGSLVVASQQLEELIYSRPRQESYYQDLVLVYKRRGMYDKAINTCDAAMATFGYGNSFFIDQKVGMLCGQGRQQEALAFLLELKKTNSHAAQLYQTVADDIQSLARANDPYESTAKQYEKRHNIDDLNYLLSTSVNKGFYDGLIFHRVIKGFMIQGGDPEGIGIGGPGYSIKGEFSQNGFKNDLKHDRGVLSMARTAQPNSAGSQFFIMHQDSPHLDGAYAAFGRVIEGLEVIDSIAGVAKDYNDRPLEDQVIESMTADTDGVTYPEPEKC